MNWIHILKSWNEYYQNYFENKQYFSKKDIKKVVFDKTLGYLDQRTNEILLSRGMEFYPQLKVGKYYPDFVDKKRKIIIEVDGKNYHDLEKDKIKDQDLNKLGYDVYRISYNMFVEMDYEEYFFMLEMEIDHINNKNIYELKRKYYCKTAEGIIDSIYFSYYNPYAFYDKDLVLESLLFNRHHYEESIK